MGPKMTSMGPRKASNGHKNRPLWVTTSHYGQNQASMGNQQATMGNQSRRGNMARIKEREMNVFQKLKKQKENDHRGFEKYQRKYQDKEKIIS